MRPSLYPLAAIAAITSSAAIAVPSAGPRDLLVRAAFITHDKSQAIALVNGAIQSTDATLARTPGDREAKLQRAIALGYRGQLTRAVGDARASRDALIALARAYPRDPEVQIALAGWHLSVVADLGGFLGSTLLGASRDTGLQVLDKAVALDGKRAFFPAYAGLMRLRTNPKDTRTALALMERAAAATAPTPVDRITQASAGRVAALLRAGNTSGAVALAKQLLPFGTAT